MQIKIQKNKKYHLILMGRRKKIEFYDKTYIEKIIKTIKRSHVIKFTGAEIIGRRDKYNMQDNKNTDCFETYTVFTTNLYYDYINKSIFMLIKHVKKTSRLFFTFL